MNMKDRFERQDNEDIVIIGEAIDHFMRSDLGGMFTKMISNLQKMELQNSRSSNSADRSLGRIEAYDMVLNDFLGFVERMKELQKPIDPAPPETVMATEQVVTMKGGEI